MFLDVLTRCYKRPLMLAENVDSLLSQTDDDWRQLFIEDHIGIGIDMAQIKLAEHTRYLQGDYVWVLDDDNLCTRTTLVAELKQIAAEHDPDVIMVKTERGRFGVYPRAIDWGKEPRLHRIDSANAIVRRAYWAQHADAWRSARYQSDYDFIHALWEGGGSFYWHDVVASRAQRISLGEPE